MKKAFHSISLVCVSILIALCMAEIVARMALAPGYHSSLPMVPDDTLGTRIPDGALGYDDWGFRNASVPDKADIITIGDSQTFGVNASLGSSWPEHLENMSSRSVYNLSSEGYGPVQYYHLFSSRALKLQPEKIVVGYYIGNDPLNSFEMVYHHPTWDKLQNKEFSAKADTAQPDSLDMYLEERSESQKKQWVSILDSWLAGKSMIYRLGFHNDYVKEWKTSGSRPQVHQASSSPALSISSQHGTERFNTLQEAYKMDLNNEKIQEGLRLTLDLFKKMKKQSEQQGIEFTVLLIPTKEMVFSHYLFGNDGIKYADAIDKMLNNERLIREISMKHFRNHDINYIDALPTLQQAIENESIDAWRGQEYPDSGTYQLIAQSFYKYMESRQIANK